MKLGDKGSFKYQYRKGGRELKRSRQRRWNTERIGHNCRWVMGGDEEKEGGVDGGFGG